MTSVADIGLARKVTPICSADLVSEEQAKTVTAQDKLRQPSVLDHLPHAGHGSLTGIAIADRLRMAVSVSAGSA